tara:strand:- start:14 stop:325 length:312 start_codon:yes stop_codon:yes gene_type:complete
MATQIQTRRDTSANWASVNPILLEGEMGYETDTLKLKVGDGTSLYTALTYTISQTNTALSGTSIQRVAATATPVGISFWDTDLKIPCYLESAIWYNAAGGIIT